MTAPYKSHFFKGALRGLVLWLAFREGTGTAMADMSSYGAGGTISGASWALDGGIWSLTMATNDYITVANRASLQMGTGDYTIEAWVKTSATGAYQCILEKNFFSWGFALDPSGYLWNYTYDGSETYRFGSTNVADGAWHHVAARRTSGTMDVLLDGVNDNGSLQDQGTITLPTTGAVNIGYRVDDSIWPWTGSMASVRVFNRSVSDADLLRRAKLGRP